MRRPAYDLRALAACLAAICLSAASCGGTVLQVVSPGASGQGPGLTAEEQRLVDEAPGAATSGGCQSVKSVPPYAPEDLDRAHIGGSELPTMPPLSSYPSQPPASGPHEPSPLPAGVYDEPPVARTIHSLEHAAVVIWVDPTVLDSDPQTKDFYELKAFFTRSDESDHVIVASYFYEDQGAAGRLPEGTSMALVAWHRLRLCRQVSLPVAFAFVSDFRFDPADPERYRGEAPELGVPIG